jgi:diaminopimelate epimerase
MGPVRTDWQDVPLARASDTLSLDLGHDLGPVVCHSMGNPHAIAFVDDVDAIDLAQIGPIIEHHEIFPERVNFSIVAKQDDGVFRMRVWERGVGITMACGSGACAVGAAIYRRGLGGRHNQPVFIDWIDDGSAGGRVMLIGPIAYSYSGALSPELAALLAGS